MSKYIFQRISVFMIAGIVSMSGGLALSDESGIGLDEFTAEVFQKNPELKFYQAEIQAVEGLRTTAGLLANPEASGSIGQKKVWNEDDALTGKGETGDISLVQTFEWPGRMGLRRAIADRDIELAKLGLEQFRAGLAAEIRIKAYQFYAAREIETATRGVADHFQGLRKVLSERDPAGLTPLLEARVIEAMDLNIQRKASEAALVAQTALFDLNRLRGTEPNTALSLRPIKLRFNPFENQKELSELARTNDFEVRTRAIEFSKRSSEVGLAESERLPAVSVGPSFSQEEAGDRERVMAVAVSMPLPLWNQNQGNIQTAKARRNQSEVSLEIAKREAQRHFLEAAAIYQMKIKEMQSWKPDSIQHFQEAAELADRHYRLGAVPVSIYVDLQSQYLEAIAGLHETKKEALAAAAQLEILAGKPLSLVQEDNS